MSYYTERHGLRRIPIEKTEIISCDAYNTLLSCCKNHFINMAWKFPQECLDGRGICGIDERLLNSFLKIEIPSLYRDFSGAVGVPEEGKAFDRYAILDLIECVYINGRSYINKDYHDFFKHYHMVFNNSWYDKNKFRDEINNLFEKTGLQFTLSEKGIVERVFDNSVLTNDINTEISKIKENGVKELLQQAITAYKSPYPEARQDAAEKIWDALERLKTYYTTLGKKNSAAKIVSDMAHGQEKFIDLFNLEFKALTDIGNNFRIRHHETNKTDITDSKHYDYFFNRCLSLIALAILYLK